MDDLPGDEDTEVQASAAAVAAAEAALEAARRRARVAVAKAKSAKGAKANSSRARTLTSHSPERRSPERKHVSPERRNSPERRAGQDAEAPHVRKTLVPEPGLLLKNPVGLHVPGKKNSPPKSRTTSGFSGTKAGGSSSIGLSRTRTPREQRGGLGADDRSHNSDSSGSPDPRLFLTLTPRSESTVATTATEKSVNWSSDTTFDDQQMQHQRLVIPGEGIYAGAVARRGMRSGYGKMWFVDGLVYEGEWVANQMKGTGKMVYDTGAIYEGEFDFGMRHGTGTLCYTNSDEYVGQWSEDNKEGHGVFTFHSDGGSSYSGQWLAGVMHGHGTYTFADGCQYIGSYVDGRRHGTGVFVNADGSRDHGEWRLGKRVIMSTESLSPLNTTTGGVIKGASASIGAADVGIVVGMQKWLGGFMVDPEINGDSDPSLQPIPIVAAEGRRGKGNGKAKTMRASVHGDANT